ncbi:MAG TPA: energy transducer TonB [Sphingomicrobium sp.]|nr:energy transducer TonB [Sphingomicrobium sp.]
MYIAFLYAIAAATTATPIDRSTWFNANDYPFEAIKKGLQGSVGFEVDVDPDGKPTSCQVTKSSGQQILDQTTCEVVRSRAHFHPALDAKGRPVSGHYSTSAIWRLAGDAFHTFHHAVILDFSSDPGHPSCIVQTTAPAGNQLPTCEQTLAQSRLMETLSKKWSLAVILIAAGAGDEQVYKGEPGWGTRLSYLANEQYRLKGQNAVGCLSVAAEGMTAGQNACAAFPAAQPISDADKKNALKIGRFELSTFGLPRPAEQHASGCRTGEAAGESSGCN